jgi:hypothetical protein
MLNRTRLLTLTASLLFSTAVFGQAPPLDAPGPQGGDPSMERPFEPGPGGQRAKWIERLRERRSEFGKRRGGADFGPRGMDRDRGRRSDFGKRRGGAFDPGAGRDQRGELAQELRDLKVRRHELKARIAELKEKRKVGTRHGRSAGQEGRRYNRQKRN